LSAPDPETCSIVCPSAAGAAVIVGVAGAVPGTIIGMIAGARPREVWRRVPLQ
jgi:F0F1-type ATP synthase membrane subunit c/vacuolar-type H+-ATPase subunit K